MYILIQKGQNISDCVHWPNMDVFAKEHLPPEKSSDANIWNSDVQGGDLSALKKFFNFSYDQVINCEKRLALCPYFLVTMWIWMSQTNIYQSHRLSFFKLTHFTRST